MYKKIFLDGSKMLTMGIVAILFGVLVAVAAQPTFKEPSAAFPNGNVYSPINVSDQPQYKNGLLGAGMLSGGALDVTGLSYLHDSNSAGVIYFPRSGGAWNAFYIRAGVPDPATGFSNPSSYSERLFIHGQTGNVGIGVSNPESAAPNNKGSNLDVNDVYIRGAAGGGRWASTYVEGTGDERVRIVRASVDVNVSPPNNATVRNGSGGGLKVTRFQDTNGDTVLGSFHVEFTPCFKDLPVLSILPGPGVRWATLAEKTLVVNISGASNVCWVNFNFSQASNAVIRDPLNFDLIAIGGQ